MIRSLGVLRLAGRAPRVLLLAPFALGACGGAESESEPVREAVEAFDTVAPPSPSPTLPTTEASPRPGTVGSAGEGNGDDTTGEPVTIPASTVIPVVMEATLSTRTHATGDTFYVQVSDEILASDGMVLVPEGARILGRIAEAHGGDDAPLLQLTFEALFVDGATISLDAVARRDATAPDGSGIAVSSGDGHAVIGEGTKLVVQLEAPSEPF